MSKMHEAASALTEPQRAELEALLLAKREEIRNRRFDVPDDRTLEPEADPVDEASERTSEADAAAVARADTRVLREIDAALERMAAGTYGTSEETGAPIGYERLRALPWARRSAREEEEREARSRGAR